MKLIYIKGYGPDRSCKKRWDSIIIRLCFWKWNNNVLNVKNPFDLQNEFIENAKLGKYRKDHVTIL